MQLLDIGLKPVGCLDDLPVAVHSPPGFRIGEPDVVGAGASDRGPGGPPLQDGCHGVSRRTAIVDPFGDGGDILIRHWIEAGRHAVKFGTRRGHREVVPERGFAFQRLDQIGSGAVADNQQIKALDLLGDKLIPGEVAPERAMHSDIHTRTTDRQVEDVYYLLITGHLRLPLSDL